MNIKEIVLRIAQATNLHYIVTDEIPTNDDWNIHFATALIAELTKQNEPVAYRWKEKGRWLSWYVDWTWHDKAKSLGFPVEYAYTFPPTAEQIANETAKAIADYCSNQGHYCLSAEIESGEWKDFKK